MQDTCQEDMQCYLKHEMSFLNCISHELTSLFVMSADSWRSELAFKALVVAADLLSTYLSLVPLSPAAEDNIMEALHHLALQGFTPSAAEVTQGSAVLKGPPAAPTFTVHADASTHSPPATVSLPPETCIMVIGATGHILQSWHGIQQSSWLEAVRRQPCEISSPCHYHRTALRRSSCRSELCSLKHLACTQWCSECKRLQSYWLVP